MSFLSEKLADIQFSKSVMIMVDPFRLHPDPDNDSIYGAFDPEKEEDKKLIEEIKEMGLLQPLLVKRHPVLPEEYIIISGHRRYHAAVAAGLSRLEVLVMNTNTPEEQAMAKLAITVSNHSRDRSNPAIMAREMEHLEKALKELRKVNPERFRGKELRAVMAEELGVSTKTIARTKKILNNADSQTKKEFTSGKITQLEALKRIDKSQKPGIAEPLPQEEPLPGQLSFSLPTIERPKEIPSKQNGVSEGAAHTINRLVRITEQLELNPDIAADEEVSCIIHDLEKIIASKSKNKK